MPKLAKPLTDTQVKNAKPKAEPYTLPDGGGMYLEVNPSGSKIWRMSYRQVNGKNNRLTFGPYPAVSQLAARKQRDAARELKVAGKDPAKLSPLVFVRPGELRSAEWAEIDRAAAEWRIPGSKMKMKIDHLVPLSTQAVEILRNLHTLTGDEKYVFPSIRTGERCMSENTINAALRSMGYNKEVMTGHGFLAMARTILDEVLDERVDLIEHQLAHAVNDPNGRAYNHTAHLHARTHAGK